MRPLLMLGLLAAGAAHANAPQDYARQWPVLAEGDAAAYVLELDAEVLQHVSRADLRDLAVFNADGEPMPFAPLPFEHTEQSRLEPVAWLRVPLPAPGQPESLALRLERDADGRLRGLDLRTNDSTPTPPERHDLLLDRGEDPPPVSALHVQLGEGAVLPVNLRVRLSASEDLADWQEIGRGMPLVALDDNGLRIERLKLEFTGSNARYLRLSIENDGQWPVIAALQAERRLRGADTREWKTLSLEGTPVADAPGSFDYANPARVTVERMDVVLPTANAVAAVEITTRDDAEGWWRNVYSFVAFRLGNNGDEVRHVAPPVNRVRDRQWRVASKPALTRAPTLQLQYRPERFVLLAQGPRPYTLVAGSVRAAREDYPVQAALAASTAPPQPASLGEGRESGGAAAMAPKRGEDWQRWVLWAVLALGAGLVLLVSLRVLRHPKPE
jgi:hypothetical protein